MATSALSMRVARPATRVNACFVGAPCICCLLYSASPVPSVTWRRRLHSACMACMHACMIRRSSGPALSRPLVCFDTVCCYTYMHVASCWRGVWLAAVPIKRCTTYLRCGRCVLCACVAHAVRAALGRGGVVLLSVETLPWFQSTARRSPIEASGTIRRISRCHELQARRQGSHGRFIHSAVTVGDVVP